MCRWESSASGQLCCFCCYGKASVNSKDLVHTGRHIRMRPCFSWYVHPTAHVACCCTISQYMGGAISFHMLNV